MGAYRQSRNFEISTKDYIETQLNIAFPNPTINTYRGWEEVSGNNVPCVTVRLGETTHPRVGVGSFATRRELTLLIDIFATGDGQRLDVKDFLISILKKSWDYEEYTITGGASSSVTNGKITCIGISDTEVNLGIDKDELDKADRYRHLITIQVTNGKVEV